MYGKEHDVPRLHQWYGNAGLSYKWSGIVMHPEPWVPLIRRIRIRAENKAAEKYPATQFNTVLLNRYRNGDHGVSWHADDEKELGETPVIASISLGAEREFLMRHNDREDLPEVTIRLPHGSLLLMAGETQQYWKHSIPKRKGVKDERINLTFREVLSLPEKTASKRTSHRAT